MSRVFVLDYEVVSSIGIGRADLQRKISSNYSGAREISRFSVEGLPVGIGAEIVEPLQSYLQSYSPSLQKACRFDRKLEMILACYDLLRARVASLLQDLDPRRKGIVLGLGLDIPQMEDIQKSVKDKSDFQDVLELYKGFNVTGSRLNVLSNPLNIPTLVLASEMKLGAFQKSTLSACAASSQAVAFAADAIRNGQADVVVAGGTDSLLNALGLIAFSKLGIIAPSRDLPDQVCKPLDKNRSSVLLGEGAGLMILASEKFVQERSLKPKIELLGYGNTLDGYKITAPDPSGKGMRLALEQALKRSNLKPKDVDYINLHGTGTIANDPLEVSAIKEVFGEHAPGVALSSTKDRHGHLIAGAGIMELCLLATCIEIDLIPCTRNLAKPIIETGFDFVREQNRKKEIRIALSNSFAFGGVNTVLAVKRV